MSDSPTLVKTAEGAREKRRTVVTIGTYDGVHFGHRRLIAEAQSVAHEEDLDVVIVTFDRHPASVVRPESTPLMLTTLDHKLELLRSTKVDDIVVLHFDAARARESAEDFVTSVLVDELKAKFVIVGENFRFGNGRKGDVTLLEEMGRQSDFSARGFALVTDLDHHGVVSSSRIRGLIADADLEQAANLLGRPHEVRGVVAELSGLDRGLLGVVASAGLCLPPPGSYEAEVGAVGGVMTSAEIRILPPDPDSPFGNEIVLGSRDAPFRTLDGAPPTTGTWYSVQFSSPQ